jgi:ATP-binding cassette subfamily C (CFTR/MRP) protein 1
LTVLLLWAVDSPLGTRASIPAAALDFVAACALCILSSYEHTRNVAPSIIIDFYLFFSLLFDAARLRTLFLIGNLEIRSIAVVGVLSAITKLGLLVSEAAGKRPYLLERYKHLPPEATSGAYSRAIFWWLNGLLKAGYSKLLSVQDLDEIDEALSSITVGRRFEVAWAAADKTRKHGLLWTTAWVLRWELVISAMPRLVLIGFRYAQPFLLHRTITYVSNRNDQPSNVGWTLVGAYAIVYIGLAICTASFTHLLNRCLTTIRGGLVTLMYTKTIDLSLTALDEASALTLMSADVEMIITSLFSFHDLWASFFEIGIAVYLLYNQLGVTSVAPAAVFVICGGGMFSLTTLLPGAQKRWVEGIQYRVSFTSTMLGSMRSVKLLGLSRVVSTLTQALRVSEVALSAVFRRLLLVRIILQNAPLAVSPLVTFGVYIALRNPRLSSSTAFSVMSVLNLVESPLRMLIVTFPMVISSTACFVRIQEFLLSESRNDHRLSIRDLGASPIPDPSDEYRNSSSVGAGSRNNGVELTTIAKPSNQPSSEVLILEQCSFGWSEAKPRVAQDISLRIRPGTVLMIVGPVGCGKSTLLKGMLGETHSSSGFVYTGTHRVAFADQDAWVANTSIAENVRCQSAYDPEWYNTVIEACGLSQDLRIMPEGDETVVGSRGITLSGGQKQRLALARALYAKEEIVFLDDIFSGLDADTEEHIFGKLFTGNGLFRQLRTTVVLVTHAVHRLPYADYVLALGPDGRAAEQGTYESLVTSGGYIQQLSCQFRRSGSDSQEGALDAVSRIAKPHSSITEEVITNRARTTGDRSTYLYYFKSAGITSSLLSLLWIALFTLGTKLPGLLITYWTGGEADDTESANTLYLSLFGLLAVMSCIAVGLVCWQVLLDMVPRSSSGLHLRLLQTVMQAPLSFFTKTDSGTTLNRYQFLKLHPALINADFDIRFSQDMTLVDGELPFAYIETVLCAFQTLCSAGLMVATAQYFLATFPLVLLVLFVLQKFYLRTSRQIRLLDIEAKAPLYSHFQETLSGVATIRAFGWTCAFVDKNLDLLDQSQRPFYLLYCIQRWLQVVLDLMVAALATILMIIVVSTRHEINPGLVGLGMLNVMTFNTDLTGLVKNWTLMEISIGAVARIKDFVRDTHCEVKSYENIEPPHPWPQSGALQIKHFSASYSETSVPVLHGISLDIKAGEKVGICGRSGSGKSSLLASLLHILESREGSISIDGLDIAYMPRDTLRQRLNVITQEPYWITSESVRFNMNPWYQAPEMAVSSALTPSYTDDQLISALTRCQVWPIIMAKGGLSAKMDAEFLSHGQRQLFCLARAILRKSRVVILDEVSASVDVHTDVVMQGIIREEFKDCMIISVAHRLDTIVDFDRVVVLEEGRVIEAGVPEELLKREGGRFRGLYER